MILNATSLPHGYQFLDFKLDTQEILRVRSNILPNDKTIVYIKKYLNFYFIHKYLLLNNHSYKNYFY